MITNKYLLFVEAPLIKDKHGKYYCDSLWAKDLKLHTNYISNLSICCPIIKIDNPTNLEELKKYSVENLTGLIEISSFNLHQIHELKYCRGWLSVFINFFPNLFRISKACKVNEIVHSGGAGWPFPLSFYLLLLKPFHTFKWIVLIESTFFLMTKDEKFKLRRFVGHHFHMSLLPPCVNAADARIFIQEHYKNLFLKGNDRALIEPITYLDDDQFLKEKEVTEKLLKKANKTIKLILASRLLKSKGLYILFDAIEKLELAKIKVRIDIMGSGELETECRDFIKCSRKFVEMSFIETVPYGEPFLKYIRQYDALLLPSLSDEQPRIIFDAFSQGLCIIGSKTAGITSLCKQDENAILFEIGDSTDLASVITNITSSQKQLVEMGIRGLELAKTRTHQKNHENREVFLTTALDL